MYLLIKLRFSLRYRWLIVAILFKSFALFVPIYFLKLFSFPIFWLCVYSKSMSWTLIDFVCIWWRLFQKHVMNTYWLCVYLMKVIPKACHEHLLTLCVPDEGYSRSMSWTLIPDEGYSRNMLWTLNSISTFVLTTRNAWFGNFLVSNNYHKTKTILISSQRSVNLFKKTLHFSSKYDNTNMNISKKQMLVVKQLLRN